MFRWYTHDAIVITDAIANAVAAAKRGDEEGRLALTAAMAWIADSSHFTD